MKQCITIEQLNELSEENKLNLREWWYYNHTRSYDLYAVLVKYDDLTRYEERVLNHNNLYDDYHIGEAIPLLSIGQMIEFLQEGKVFINDWGYDPKDVIGSIVSWFTIDQSKSELADVLWEVVIKHLNQ